MARKFRLRAQCPTGSFENPGLQVPEESRERAMQMARQLRPSRSAEQKQAPTIQSALMKSVARVEPYRAVEKAPVAPPLAGIAAPRQKFGDWRSSATRSGHLHAKQHDAHQVNGAQQPKGRASWMPRKVSGQRECPTENCVTKATDGGERSLRTPCLRDHRSRDPLIKPQHPSVSRNRPGARFTCAPLRTLAIPRSRLFHGGRFFSAMRRKRSWRSS